MNLETDHPETGRWQPPRASPLLIGALKFACPLGIIAALLAALYLTRPYQDFLFLSGLMAAYFIPPAGKESIIPIAVLVGQPWWLITVMLFLLDAAVALFIAWNFDLALKIPFLGRILENGMAVTQKYTETQPWIRGLSSIGLFLFVFFPFQGTGAMNGSILGRLLGMDRYRVLGCVMAGSFASCVVIALGSDLLLDVYRQDPALGIALIGAVAAAIVAGLIGWRIYRKRFRERKP
jgi:uncharacterized membrane protein